MIKIVGVRFRSAGKVYYFDPKDLELRMGDHVIAETSKGLEYGVISTCMKTVDEELVQQPLRALNRKATPEDEERIEELRAKEREAMRVCREKVREHGLEMKMVDAEYSFDGSKVLFYFTADGRVDFRNLVKDLAGIFHVRIELRQIGVRDETRMLGGIGICGRELCCATFLRDFQPVSIKMAKEQNLSLNPAKISGTCGRLMCCLKNEEATYEYLNARMPKLGEEAITSDGQSGKVVELDVLRQRVRVLFEDEDSKEIETFPVAELTFRPRKKKDPSQQGKKTIGEKGEKTDRADKSEKAGRGDGERPEKTEQGERPERSERPEKTGQGERSERSERSEKAGQGERPERNERPDKGERAEKTEKAEPDRGPKKEEKTVQGDQNERSLKTEKDERSDRLAEENDEKFGHGRNVNEAEDAAQKPEKPERPVKAVRPEKDPRPDRRERGDRQEKAPRRERSERTERIERTERGEKSGRNDRAERGERTDRGERAERGERTERIERTERGEKTGRNDRAERGERTDRGDRAERGERSGRNDRAERGERIERSERPERGERTDRGERAERGERSDRSARADQGDRTQRPEYKRPRRRRGDNSGRVDASAKGENSGKGDARPTGAPERGENRNAARKNRHYRPRKAEETGSGHGAKESGGAD